MFARLVSMWLLLTLTGLTTPPAQDAQSIADAATLGGSSTATQVLLKQQILSPVQEQAVLGWIALLESSSFRDRTEASQNLENCPNSAFALLREHLKDPGLERQRRLERCLAALEKTEPRSAVLEAAVRATTRERPAGLCEILLDLLPDAPDEGVHAEILESLKGYDGDQLNLGLAGREQADTSRKRQALERARKELKGATEFSYMLRAQRIATTFLSATNKGDAKTLSEIAAVPFDLGDSFVLQSRAEFNELFTQIAAESAKNPVDYRIMEAVRGDDRAYAHLKRPDRYDPRDLRAVHIIANQKGEKEDEGFVWVHFENGTPHVVGLGPKGKESRREAPSGVADP